LTFGRSGSGCCSCAWRTVREELSSRLFIVFFMSSCIALFRSIGLGVFSWSRFAELSVRVGLSAGWPQTVCFSRCSTGCSGCIFEPSAVTSRTVRLDLADRTPGHRGPSAPGIADCLSPLLLELRFHVALSFGLFLGLVGPL
jgi:hypothetical protein